VGTVLSVGTVLIVGTVLSVGTVLAQRCNGEWANRAPWAGDA
jgi:hypothetical protein